MVRCKIKTIVVAQKMGRKGSVHESNTLTKCRCIVDP